MWLKHAKKPIVAVAPILDGSAASFLEACKEAGIALVDITLEHAVAAAALPRVHRDPFDRMLVEQTIVERLTAVTDDPAFRRYKRIRVFVA